jgi:SAM-dependent methyltransferase
MVPLIDDASYYEQEALWVPNLRGAAREATRIAETAQLIPADVRTVLDVGAGDGLLVHFLKSNIEWLSRIVALDRSDAALKQLKVDSVRASCDTLPLVGRAFDLVLACEVLEHLPMGIFESTLRELQRVAGKYILITVPNAEDRSRSRLRCPYCGCVFHRNRHLRSFDPDRLDGLFSSFTLITTKPIGPKQRFYPQWGLTLAGRFGIVPTQIPGAPVCPQCGFNRFITTANSKSVSSELQKTPPFASGLRRFLRFGRVFLPKQVREPWLAGLYQRNLSEA